jgi:hypothetical protein
MLPISRRSHTLGNVSALWNNDQYQLVSLPYDVCIFLYRPFYYFILLLFLLHNHPMTKTDSKYNGIRICIYFITSLLLTRLARYTTKYMHFGLIRLSNHKKGVSRSNKRAAKIDIYFSIVSNSSIIIMHFSAFSILLISTRYL